MKIGVAQTIAIRGDIEKNRAQHKQLIAEAIHFNTNLLIFPELSLTGFEPELAADLAVIPGDPTFFDFQEISDHHEIILGVGMPTRTAAGNTISLLLFKPHQPLQVYSKQVLHPDEYPFFIGGSLPGFLDLGEEQAALGICYEASLPGHVARAFEKNASLFIASTLHAVSAIDEKLRVYAGIAKNYKMTVVMANYAGESGGYACAGRSSIWTNNGALAGQLNDHDAGILVIDTKSNEVFSKHIRENVNNFIPGA